MSPKARAQRMAVGVSAGDVANVVISLKQMEKALCDEVLTAMDDNTYNAVIAAWDKA